MADEIKPDAAAISGEFHSLVRECFSASEQFDMFDPRSPDDYAKLDKLSAEWRSASNELVRFAQFYGDVLLDHWRQPVPTGRNVQEEDRAAYLKKRLQEDLRKLEWKVGREDIRLTLTKPTLFQRLMGRGW
jgi:hypothetical protein